MALTYTIQNSGMGGFLNPPGDAEYTHSIQEGIGRNAGSLSLRYALTCAYIPAGIKDAIRSIMAAHPPQFTPEWEGSVYAYFKGCYSPDGIERNIGKLVHSGPPENHLAYLHIREFFPEYTPNLELIANPPSWGKVA